MVGGPGRNCPALGDRMKVSPSLPSAGLAYLPALLRRVVVDHVDDAAGRVEGVLADRAMVKSLG